MHHGYFGLLLHAHLPFVRHPEHRVFLEENWLFEAISESYLPLLRALLRLDRATVPFRLTLSVSSTLVSMLQDELLQQRYLAHMERLIGLAHQETKRRHADQRTQQLATFYLERFELTLSGYRDEFGCNLIAPLHQLHKNGRLELITTAATHGFLPLLRTEPGAVRAQLATAAEHHRNAFGEASPGIWLPECGYFPGLENALAEQGFRYFVVDSHGLLHASQKPWHGVAAPLACPNGVAAFGRDPESSRQVWSAEEGYPGDDWYRDFHKDIGFDRPETELKPFLPSGVSRVHTGIKYFRVTNQGRYKQPYEPARARERLELHAQDFVAKQRRAILALGSRMERPPMLLAPYDAELFGHWWYEGVDWLERVIELLAQQRDIELISPYDYLLRHPKLQVGQPSASSWGELGYNAYWLNEENDWIYPHLHRAARAMRRLAAAHLDAEPDSLLRRALQQAGRSLLLAQASDWPFILKSGTTTDYVEQRLRDLLARFHYLENAIDTGSIDPRRLAALEQLDQIFPELDIAHFLDQE